MTQSPPSPVVSRRNKLLMQLMAFIALAVVLYYRPQVEAWVSARQADPNSTAAAQTPEPNPETPRPRPRPQFHPAGPPDDFDAELPGGFNLPGTTPNEDDAEAPAPAPRKGNSKRTKGDVAKKNESPKNENTNTPEPTESTGPASGSTDSESTETRPDTSESDSTAGAKDESPSPEDAVEPSSEKDSSTSDDSGAGKSDVASSATGVTENSTSDAKDSKKSDSSNATKSNEKKKSDKKGSVSRMEREPAPKRTAGGSSSDAASNKDGTGSEQNPDWGKLKEIRNNVFESTAGLVYRSGSADGHRLKHVMQHAKDNTSKPIHGVFIGEGDRDIVLALIDEAFEKTKKGGKDVRKEDEGERLVYTVNMKRQVGFMGGQAGERRGNPECRYIRIVLENENEVISAFPTDR